MDTEELLARVQELERRVAFLMEAVGIGDRYASAHPAPGDGDVLALARAGKMIDAIKAYRQKHNASLTEAKAAVEAMLAGR